MNYNKNNPLRVFEAFSGYGSQALALERLKRNFPEFDYILVGTSEIDADAIKAYSALHPGVKNYGDISKIDWSEVPDFDLFTYSSPCQDFSQAGLQRGGEEGSGTRSSLLWECKRAIEAKKPRYLLLENVAALVSQKFLPLFNRWRELLESYGYSNFAQVLNARHYGVPQNRERIFLMSILDPSGDVHYNFPEPMPLRRNLNDLLLDTADVKYYLNPNRVNQFVRDNLVKITEYASSSNEKIEPLPQHLREWLESFPEEDLSDNDVKDALDEKAYEAETGLVGDLFDNPLARC